MPIARYFVNFSFILFTFSATLSCESSPSSTTPVSYSQTGTCASTCQKSVAAVCAAGPSSVSTCTTDCEAQIARCNDPAIVALYLDCVESTPMSCGEFTSTASSAECVTPGLTYGACIAGLTPGPDTVQGDVSGDISGATDGVSGDVADLVPPGAAAGELVATIRDGASDTEIRCTVAAALDPIATIMANDGGFEFQLTCFDGMDSAKQNHGHILRWWQANTDAGTYTDAQVKDFTVHLITENVGISVLSTPSLPLGMTFALQLDAPAVPGGTLRGSIIGIWTDAFSYAGKGSSAQLGPRPGQIAVSFDLPL